MHHDEIHVSDGHVERFYVGLTPEEAAQTYVDEGDWGGPPDTTTWVRVTTWRVGPDGDEGDPDTHTIAVDPPEPECEADAHDWQAPGALVAGLEENPGVFGHGGGVVITRVCVHCGRYRVEDTWAQDPATGEQGLRSLEYRDPDDDSLAWIREKEEATDE